MALEAVQYRPCPDCHQRMNRVNYARHSGVVLDVCKEHGLWFDKDELRRVLAFISAGGLDRAREAELEELKGAKRAEGRIPEPLASPAEFVQPMNLGNHWLGAAGLAWASASALGSA